MPNDSLTSCLAVAANAARRAGVLLVRYMGRPATVETKRSAVDLVTEIDRRSEQLIHAAIRRRFPSHGFQGEERTRTHPDAPYQWIVDPLDGTMNFVHGVPVFAVSIGLRVEGSTRLGLIYDPTRREMFTAVAGRGAFLNGRRIRVSRTARLAESLLSTGFSSTFRTNPAPLLRWFTAFQSRCRGVRRIGSSAVSLAYVACGRHDGFYEQELWPWDIAAGLLLVEEAGGRVTDFRGRPITRLEDGVVVASNGRIHPEMLALLRCSAPRATARRARSARGVSAPRRGRCAERGRRP